MSNDNFPNGISVECWEQAKACLASPVEHCVSFDVVEGTAVPIIHPTYGWQNLTLSESEYRKLSAQDKVVFDNYVLRAIHNLMGEAESVPEAQKKFSTPWKTMGYVAKAVLWEVTAVIKGNKKPVASSKATVKALSNEVAGLSNEVAGLKQDVGDLKVGMNAIADWMARHP